LHICLGCGGDHWGAAFLSGLSPAMVRRQYNPSLGRTAAAVYFTCGRASRVRRPRPLNGITSMRGPRCEGINAGGECFSPAPGPTTAAGALL
jgi:hypothetical protein